MQKLVIYCIIITILIPLAGVSVSYAYSRHTHPPAEPWQKDSLRIKTGNGELRFSIEVARTPEQMAYGLMNRETLPDDYAMLFLFKQESVLSMWMKDTLLPLDMLFIDKHGRIVYIEHRTTPNSTDEITSHYPALAVLEMKGGTADSKQIKPGDMVIHPYFAP